MKKILVVDDKEGYAVELAEGGEEALEKLKRSKPDLVALGLKMPGMGGLEVLERIREQDKDLPDHLHRLRGLQEGPHHVGL